ncbi:MAG: phosphatase PAP2 family protein [Oscillospiraceae bacterium]|nr:phosphatase PAP2 family protein [Oscillospiraceae bacterium]
MLRRTLQRVIPTYAVLPLAITGIMNLLSFSGTKLFLYIFGLGTPIDQLPRWTTAGDALFPYTPIWAIAYIASFAFWFYLYTTVAKESPEAAYRLVAADFCGKLVCLICFIVVPSTLDRPTGDAIGTGFGPFLIRVIYWTDDPTNLFPSLHCFIAWLGTRYIFEAKKLRFRALNAVLCVIGSLMVFVSTLYTKQHVIVDVYSGVALAEICYLIGKYTKLPNLFRKLNEWFMTTKLCKFYDTENWRDA